MYSAGIPTKSKPVSGSPDPKPARSRISQGDIPSIPLAQALRVPRAIADHYAKSATRPIDLAAALEMSPTSGRSAHSVEPLSATA